MERKHDAITPIMIPTAPSTPNEREKAARIRPRHAHHARSPLVPAGPPNLSPPTAPFAPPEPAPLDVLVQGLGRGKRGLMPPLEMFQAGKTPDGEDKEERSELLETCIMFISPSLGGRDRTPVGARVGGAQA